MNTNEHNGESKPLEWFVNSLLQSTGQLELIVQHMLRFDAETDNKSALTIHETLQELISGTLEHSLDRDPEEYAAATVLLADVRKAIEDEICLVEPGAFDEEIPPPAEAA